MHDGMQYNPI